MLHCIPVASSDMTAWLPQNLYRYLSSPLVSRLFDTRAKIGEKGESLRYFVTREMSQVDNTVKCFDTVYYRLLSKLEAEMKQAFLQTS